MTAIDTRSASREYIGLLAFTAIITAVHVVRPAASYRVLELEGSAAVVGMIAASYAVLSAFAAVPLGRNIDRAGPKIFFLAGSLLAGLSMFIAAYGNTIASLVLAQMLLGLGQIAAAIAFQTITANRSETNRERSFARLSAAASIGQLIGPALGGVLIGSTIWSAASFRTTPAFVIAGGITFTAFFVGLFMGRSADLSARRPTSGDAAPRTAMLSILKAPGMSRALLASAAVLTSLDLMIAYLPVIGEQRGIAPAVVGSLLSLRAMASLASRLSLTRILDRFGRRRTLVVAMAASGIAMASIGIAASPILIGIALVISGYGLGVGSPLTMAWVSAGTVPTARGTALGLRMTGNRIGQVVIPLGVGAVAALSGPGVVFGSIAAMLLMAARWVTTGPKDWSGT